MIYTTRQKHLRSSVAPTKGSSSSNKADMQLVFSEVRIRGKADSALIVRISISDPKRTSSGPGHCTVAW